MTYKHGLSTASQVGFQENAEPLVELWSVHFRPQVPVEEVANLLALQSSFEQEAPQSTVMVGFKLEDLQVNRHQDNRTHPSLGHTPTYRPHPSLGHTSHTPMDHTHPHCRPVKGYRTHLLCATPTQVTPPGATPTLTWTNCSRKLCSSSFESLCNLFTARERTFSSAK